MNNSQKTPLARSLSLFAEQKALNEIQKTGRALPGHVLSVAGSIVTINFDVMDVTIDPVEMPLFGPEYIRYPIQAGDKGFAMSADAFLGAVSGLGMGVADLQYQRGNLSQLVWMPIGNTDWTTVTANYLVMYGKNGVIIQDVATATPSKYIKLTSTAINLALSNTTVTMDASSITLTAGGTSIRISSAGIELDGTLWETHTHLPGTYVVGSTPVTGISGII